MSLSSAAHISAKMSVAVIGGGLAGCECALALAGQGVTCTIYEQKPHVFSAAHGSADLGELVCSNSFRSNDAEKSGVGLLKEEMRALGSAVMKAAGENEVPAGKALAVDRGLFSRSLTRMVEEHPLITLERRAVDSLDDPVLDGRIVVVAAGPLASAGLAASLQTVIREGNDAGDKETDNLYFYDAIAPIVRGDSINRDIAFRGSRYGNDAPPPYTDDAPLLDEEGRQAVLASFTDHDAEGGDYLNCPMSREEYDRFYRALMEADKVPAHDFEKEIHFEGCMPIEALAERGERTLTFGPLKPVGFTDPRTGRRPYALVQLRAENRERTAFNLVGCQTKMTYGAQDSVFRLIPGLEKAEFLRFGSVHRNTYVNAPRCLNPDLSLKARPAVYLAGQITGVEGYVESAACGLWLGLSLGRELAGKGAPARPPATTALGSLLRHLESDARHFQPSNIHFGLMPEPDEKVRKNNRKKALTERARHDFSTWITATLIDNTRGGMLPN